VGFKPGERPERLRFDVEIAAQPELAFDRGGPIDLEAGEERARRRADEWALVRRAQGGDVSAFEVLYRDNVPRVFALCCRLAGDPALAEELAQDVFVRAWQRLETFRGESAFSSWLYPLTVNVALSERRSRRRRNAHVLATDDLTPFEKAPERPARPEAAVDLERAMATLPPGARAVFVLHDVEGYKHEEIAELTGVATGTSKAQLHRARRLLREVLRG
jgi:RNA polymerase sigma-70 factor, ECF subfamily